MDQPTPHTVRSLSSDLRALGVREGDVLEMHSSFRSLGYVAGGPQAVVEALLAALGPGGTLVVPTHSSDNSDPADWQNPPVPEAWWPVIRGESPPFDPLRTPASRWMGVLAETVRAWPGAHRSDHPQVSMAAVGARAAEIVAEHQLDDALGEHSPLGAINRLDGKVLLLGCGYSTNTSLHLAEWRQASPPRGIEGATVRQSDGSGRWTTWTDVDTDEEDFDAIGEAFEAAVGVAVGPVGNATARLMSQRALVDFATAWMAANRTQVT
jgi:aminoglycoside 3-N-acetyltransferase